MKYIIALFIIFIVVFLTQLFKIVSYYITHKKLKLSIAIESGGMPSSHAAGTSSLATLVFLVEGNINNWYFIFSLILLLIVCYDSFNIRWYGGINTSKINNIIKNLNEKNLLETNDILEKKAKEVLGHRKIEVFWGIIFGSVLSYAVFYIFSLFLSF